MCLMLDRFDIKKYYVCWDITCCSVYHCKSIIVRLDVINIIFLYIKYIEKGYDKWTVFYEIRY